MPSEVDYQDIDERVETRIQREKKLAKFLPFVVNLILFIGIMGFAWQRYLADGGIFPSFDQFSNLVANPLLLVSFGWSVGLLIQFVGLIMSTPLGEWSMRESATEQVIHEEVVQMRKQPRESREKRKGMMRLTDDGELEAIGDVDLAEVEVLNQQNRKA